MSISTLKKRDAKLLSKIKEDNEEKKEIDDILESEDHNLEGEGSDFEMEEDKDPDNDSERKAYSKMGSRKLWSSSEDDAIMELVKAHGTKRWTYIA